MTDAGPIAAPPASRPRREGLLALILGIVALVLAFLPFASYVAGFVGIAAIVLGVLAVRKAVRKGMSIAGIVLGALALVVGIVMSIVYSVLFFVIPAAVRNLPTDFPSGIPTDFPTPSALESAPTSGDGGTVVFEVTGDGSARSISYTAADSGGAGTDQLTDVDLPWTRSVGIEDGSGYAAYALVAQNAGSGDITCTITLNGEQVSTNTSSGENSVVSCTATDQ